MNLYRPLTDLQRKGSPELAIAGIMAAARAAYDHGSGSDHGGRSAILDSNRRRIVGILCSKLRLAELGGVLIQVYLLLTFTSFVKNPDLSYSLQLLVCPGNAYGYGYVSISLVAVHFLKSGLRPKYSLYRATLYTLCTVSLLLSGWLHSASALPERL